jgi:hypothetical protein
MIAILVLLIAAATALATWLAGWWSVVVMALIVGALWRHRHAAWLTALGAAIGWGALLAADAGGARLMTLAHRMGGVFMLPGPALLTLTLVFVALLAWSAAAVARELRRIVLRSRATAPSDSGED